MSNSHQLLQIRNRKLGLLITDARRSLRRSVEECADAAGVSPEQFQEFEKGASAPSLPELEMLALYFNLPVEHFWGHRALSAAMAPEALQDKDRLILLRNRVIGTNLRLARNTANMTYQDVFDKTGISEEALKRYELGEDAVPTPVLELLTATFNSPIEQFYDQHGPIGKWRSQQGNVQKFLDLPPDLQQFISKPVNRPYLELAMRLSDLSVDKLRAVAEVLLEITY